jgi:hypothetical protein
MNKKMKNSIKVLAALVVMLTPGVVLKAQNVKAASGVYLTENDYKNNKLSYVINSPGKLQLNDFLGGKNIKLTYQGKKVKLSKSGIFGVSINNQAFRFYHNDTYKILDTAGFMLYSRQTLTQGTKGYIPAEHYFYSRDIGQPVLDLTVANLWNSFPKDTKFRYSLQNYFHSDSDLIAFDQTENQYKLKYLYFDSKKVLAAHR